MPSKTSTPRRRLVQGPRPGWVLGIAGVVLATTLVGTSPARKAPARMASAASEPVTSGGSATFRRLSEAQYKRSIADIFGADITVPGRFDPPLREEGLLAIGNGKVVVSSSGIEQHELRAREIAAQVLAESRRKALLPCTPQSPQAFDQACAAAFLGKYGRLLYRHPLSEGGMASVMGVARAATEKSQNFHKGLEIGLSRLLASPNFIFRAERSEPDPNNPGTQRLDAYSLATRISFLLWDAPPDSELLDAAASGALRDDAGLAQQVDRLLASPRFEQGVRAFFSDMFSYDQFDAMAKDQMIYPKYTSQLGKDAREQALRTIVDLLITNRGDYRDLFATRKTFLNRNLASLYRVPVSGAGVEGWIPYTFGPKDPRAGILTLPAFLMLDPADSHQGRSSPTIRGKSVRELLLCEEVPLPPPNVNFSIVQDVKNPNYRTARQRLAAHAEDAQCAGCHKITDPIGLSMEHYDATGAYRTHENDARIDASGDFEGKKYTNVLSLTRILRDSPTAPSCVVQRTYEYGVGRQVAESEGPWLEYAARRFAEDGYTFPALMRRISTSKAFQAVSTDTLIASN